MKRFIEGVNRTQSTLFPESLEDYISEDNPVRVIDVFVDGLSLEKLGFASVRPEVTGRPAYHPSTLLKLYIYGYLNRVQSSRRLERETQRNVELMWLLNRLTPDHKTIADFRKDQGRAIRGVCREFVLLCRRLEPVWRCHSGHRRQQVQSREQPRQEFHRSKARSPHSTTRGKYRPLPDRTRSRGSRSGAWYRRLGSSTEREDCKRSKRRWSA